MAVTPPTRGQQDWDDEMNNLLQSLDAAAQSAATNAQAAVSTANTARDIAQSVHTAVIGAPDAAVAGLVGDPASGTSAALSATIAAGTPSSPTVATSVAFGDLGATPVVIDRVGSTVYGAVGNTLHRMTTGGGWESVRTFAGVPGIRAVHALPSGELILVDASGIFRTTGFATNPATATAALVLAPNDDTVFLAWGVAVHGNRIAAVSYQNNPYTNSRYLKVSTDGGSTWVTRYDLNTQYPANTADVHWHGVCWDAFHNDATPRLWASHGDGPRAVFYSDDLGVTWTTYTSGAAGTASGFGLGNGLQPTAMVATSGGIVLGTDEEPSGVYFVDRVTMKTRILWAFRGRVSGSLYGIAQRAQVADDGTVYIGFQNIVTGEAPIIVSVAPDGRSARLFYTGPAVTAQTGQFNNVVGIDGNVYASGSHNSVAKTLTAAVRPSASVTSADLGASGLTGGIASQRAVAVGAASTAGAGGVTVGERTTAATNGTALGDAAVAGVSSVAIGKASTAGATSVAVGGDSKAGDGSVVVGQGMSVQLNTIVAVGYGQTWGEFGNGVGVGPSVKVLGNYCVAIGESAETGTAWSSTAIGRTAKATHGEAVALGAGSQTVRASEVQIGARHIAGFEVASAPGWPATDDGTWLLYAADNGLGKTALYVKFSTGAAIQLAVQA